MSHIIGRGRYRGETYPTAGGSGVTPPPTSDYKLRTVPFTFDGPSTVTLLALVSGNIVSTIAVVIETPFDDPAAALNIATTSVTFLDLPAGNLETAEQFTSPTVELVAGPETLQLNLSAGASTAGNGYVVFGVQS